MVEILVRKSPPDPARCLRVTGLLYYNWAVLGRETGPNIGLKTDTQVQELCYSRATSTRTNLRKDGDRTMVHINSLTQPEYHSLRITVPTSTPSCGLLPTQSAAWDHCAQAAHTSGQAAAGQGMIAVNGIGLLTGPFMGEDQGRTAPIARRCRDS